MPNPLIIHSTPPLSPLPASDIDSIYLAALAQLQCPGRWSMATAGWGENGGDLPYVTHLDHKIHPSHLHSLPSLPHPDADLTPVERAEALAWVAYIDGKVSDLINHSLYSLPRNYPEKIAPAQAAALSFPQSVYIPQRLRGIYKARLQAVGLWGLGGMNEADLAEEDRKRLEEVYVQAPGGTIAPRAWSGWRAGKEYEDRRRQRGEEEVIKIAKEVFSILDKRLGSKPYFMNNKPTTPDLRLFAHLSLVLDTDLPNSLLSDYLKANHPNLVSHQDRLKWLLFGPDSWSIIQVTPPTSSTSWSEYLPSWSSWRKSSEAAEGEKKEDATPKKVENKGKKGRWVWYASAAALMISYVVANGIIKIEFEDEDESEDVEEIAE